MVRCESNPTVRSRTSVPSSGRQVVLMWSPSCTGASSSTIPMSLLNVKRSNFGWCLATLTFLSTVSVSVGMFLSCSPNTILRSCGLNLEHRHTFIYVLPLSIEGSHLLNLSTHRCNEQLSACVFLLSRLLHSRIFLFDTWQLSTGIRWFSWHFRLRSCASSNQFHNL